MQRYHPFDCYDAWSPSDVVPAVYICTRKEKRRRKKKLLKTNFTPARTHPLCVAMCSVRILPGTVATVDRYPHPPDTQGRKKKSWERTINKKENNKTKRPVEKTTHRDDNSNHPYIRMTHDASPSLPFPPSCPQSTHPPSRHAPIVSSL